MISVDEQMYKEKYLKYKNKYINLKGGVGRRGIFNILKTDKTAYIIAKKEDIDKFKKNNNTKNIKFNIIKKDFDKKGYIITSDDPTTIKLLDSSNLKTRTVDTITQKKDELKQTVNKNVSTVKNKGASFFDTKSIFIGDKMLSDSINDIGKDIDKIITNVEKINSNKTNFNNELNDFLTKERNNRKIISKIYSDIKSNNNNDAVISRSASPTSSTSLTDKTQSSAEFKSFINQQNVNIFDNKLNEVINIIKANNGTSNIELDYIIIEFTSSYTVKII